MASTSLFSGEHNFRWARSTAISFQFICDGGGAGQARWRPTRCATPTVQPAALRYFQGNQPSFIPAYIGEQTFMESLLQILSARGLKARLQLLDPMLPPGPEITRQMLAQMAHTRIASAVGALDDSVFLASALEA